MFKNMILLLSIFFTVLLPTTGCIYVEDDGPDYSYNAPTLRNAYVGCDWDPYYQESFWYFEVEASDRDGDLAMVGVDIYSSRDGRYLESWELVGVGPDRFAVTVYEQTYSDYLNCAYGGDFEFVFWAQDYQGMESQLAWGSGGSSYSYTAPNLRSAYVGCDWDPYYQESYWYFEVEASDMDNDLAMVGVDIYNHWDGRYLESWELTSIGYDRYAVTVYEQTYSNYLNCAYGGDFDFVFWAQDYQGMDSYLVW